MTIFALSSGPGVSGVAIIRVSGNETKNIIQSFFRLIPCIDVYKSLVCPACPFINYELHFFLITQFF